MMQVRRSAFEERNRIPDHFYRNQTDLERKISIQSNIRCAVTFDALTLNFFTCGQKTKKDESLEYELSTTINSNHWRQRTAMRVAGIVIHPNAVHIWKG